MIKERKALTMAEVSDLAGDGEKADEIRLFIKKFVKMSPKKAKEMKAELEALGLMKLKEEHIVKIVDFKPEDAIDLNKILQDASLDQDEVNKILEVTKKY